MSRTIVTFGSIGVALLLLLQLSRYLLVFPNPGTELWLVLLALLFVALGVVMARHLAAPVPQQPAKEIDEGRLSTLGISKREHEVLGLIAEGLSNREIAERLFVAESTIKTHVSNLLSKLEAKRRTQAVSRAKELRIL